MVDTMKVYDLNCLDNPAKDLSTISIGVFDGLHLGHQKILKKLISSGPSGVMTFYKHPRTGIHLIQTFSQRLNSFKNIGVNRVFIVSKRDGILSLSAEQFVKDILVPIKIKKVIVGSDFKLGHNRDTDVDTFKNICSKHNIAVEKVEILLEGHKNKLSSTDIRNKISAGDIEAANTMLGHLFCIKGFVVKGAGLGAKIGFSTANIIPHPTKQVVPANGVYKTRTTIDKTSYKSMTYVGTNPTLKEGKYYSIETHIPNFSEDLHGKVIEVEFISKIRDEIKFNSVADLVEAIRKDIEKD